MNLSAVAARAFAGGFSVTDSDDEVDAPGQCPTTHIVRPDLGEWGIALVPTAMNSRRHDRGSTKELHPCRSPQHIGRASSERSMTLRRGPAPTGVCPY